MLSNNSHSFKKYVKDEYIYEDKSMKDYNFSNEINTLMVKANMGMGKTKKLHNLFKDFKDKKIVIVSFRRTLDREYIQKFEGFMLYENIKSNTYDTDIYNKMVIQIDSFYKIRGNIDLLVLDEFTYTTMHLVERAKHKESVYNTLLEYIRNLNIKLIVMDALLDKYMVKWFYNQKRNIYYIENTFKKHMNINVNNYENKIGIFIEDIMNNLKNNKKIIIPTNSKSFLKTLEKNIKNILPNIKYKFLNADNSDDINLENWNIYDIVGYTPTIVAGVSYEIKHFDKVFGYFVNSSSCAEMSLQQLFRVRNINDNEINICIENKENIGYLTKVEDIDRYIIDRNSCLVDGAMKVKISRINKNLIKDSYYYMYRDVQIKILRSKNDYEKELINLLESQGITKVKKINNKDINKDKEARSDMKKTSMIVNEDIIKDIIKSDDIDDDEYLSLKDKNNLSYNEKNKIKKKQFRKVYKYLGEISTDMYKKYSKKYKQFRNINTLYTLKDGIIKYLEDKIQNIEDIKIDKHNQVIEELENDFGKKLLSANPFILHQDKSYEKFIIGLEIIKILGADNVFNKKDFKINFEKLLNYLKNKEYIIRLLFKCKKLDIETITNCDKGNKEMLKYINSRLRTLFNVVVKCNKKNNEYTIDDMKFWNEDINPFEENEDLKMEIYFNSLLNNFILDV
jgi:hypothetical protein